jgi:hypothetical protein
MEHQHPRSRFTRRTTHLVRRRDGRVEKARDPWHHTAHDLALSVGWRPQG